MSIAEYTQAEADWLILQDKVAAYEGEMFEVLGRYRFGFSSRAFDAEVLGSRPQPVRYRIRTEANFSVGAYCIVLEGSIGNRRMEGLCRYDVHDSAHSNNCICCAPPPQISPGHFHSHRYNECTVNRGNDWDKCAALLTIEDNAVFKRQVRSLIGNFIDDMKLTFSDSGTQQSLFETGFP